MGADALKKDNAETKEKIKLYARLIEDRKAQIEQEEIDINKQEDLDEHSVTRKLAHTDAGDVSDIADLETPTAINKSIDTEQIVSKRVERINGVTITQVEP